MTGSKLGRQLHQQALKAQEKSEFVLALQKEVKAMVNYQKDQDDLGFAEIHAMMYLTLNHLHERTNYKGYLITAKHIAKAAVELAEKSKNLVAIAVPMFNLAKIEEKLGEHIKAINFYKKAINLLKESARHNREAVRLDWENHLAVCEYKAGDKTALERAEKALTELKMAGGVVSDYERGVWLSGGHMRIAEAVVKTDKERAARQMQEAKAIIDKDESLSLRAKQWKKLFKKLKL